MMWPNLDHAIITETNFNDPYCRYRFAFNSCVIDHKCFKHVSWYEDVLPLIDAYDQVESDTSNYMTDVINSLLVINGDFSTANTNVNELNQIQG